MKKKLLCAMLTIALSATLTPFVSAPALAAGSTFTTLAVGDSHALAIEADFSLWAWGANGECGALGDGTTFVRHSPVKIMDNVIAVSAAYFRSMAVKLDGSLWAWGQNYHGLLGDGTYRDRTSPVKIMDGVASVETLSMYTMAIKTDGTLWAWGANGWGELGNGTFAHSTIPVKVLDDVTDVSMSGSHTMAIKTDGSLWAWGRNADGELGDGTTTNSATPIKIMDGVKAVYAGPGCTLAIKTDNSLWSWGLNEYGQLGDGSSVSRRLPIWIMDDVAEISMGNRHIMAIKTNGSLLAWGLNDFGQRGTASSGRSVPVKLMEDVFSVSAFTNNTMAIKNDGSLWAWGWNGYGQLGDGTDEMRDAPVRITDNVRAVFHGGSFTAAVKTDGSLWTWGRNDHGQLGDGTTTNRFRPQKIMEGLNIPDGALVPPNPQTPGDPPVIPTYKDDALGAATRLYELGLFRGVGDNADGTPDFALDRAPTRHEAVTMLVRLLGKEEDALSGEWTTPFTDVASWAKPYVGYAYANDLTTGTGAATFGGYETITASQYITFILRALGYASGSDFAWDRAWELSDELGFTNGEYSASPRDFSRGDVAVISYNALTATYKDSDNMLFDILVENGAISREAADNLVTGPLYIDGTRVVSVQYYFRMIMGGARKECKSNLVINEMYQLFVNGIGEEAAEPENFGSFFHVDNINYYYMLYELSFMETAGLDGDVIQRYELYSLTNSTTTAPSDTSRMPSSA